MVRANKPKLRIDSGLGLLSRDRHESVAYYVYGQNTLEQLTLFKGKGCPKRETCALYMKLLPSIFLRHEVLKK